MILIDDTDEHFSRREAYDEQQKRRPIPHKYQPVSLRIGIDAMVLEGARNYFEKFSDSNPPEDYN